MTVAAFLFALFKMIAALPGLVDQMKDLAAQVAGWYVNQATEATLSKIADAAAFAAKATTQEARYEAAQRWSDALKHPRIS